jgi:hypothetical protein
VRLQVGEHLQTETGNSDKQPLGHCSIPGEKCVNRAVAPIGDGSGNWPHHQEQMNSLPRRDKIPSGGSPLAGHCVPMPF